ncbi:RNA polymerase sigma-70 factor, ECF subfamily [Chitinophaga costaii]|uniref:RNA polymerase sigma-70 factor, ECF subfamily n=1 Tax=Chitinophaga costaii TaxID=1335309 RepID=A0A1C4FKQ2_9BACT|nr:sigma-70 family RNA polymerase sigma factor [Chitinophaga costaii]PUZ29991.1 hypothetical protein DCM91_00475 [Chitinophaga costaii]SCC56426.1 RNA polymerase sigma-70 factor, ECF subfamily [Chitinophaga costaii]
MTGNQPTSEAALLVLLAKGDEAAFNALYFAYSQAVYKAAMAYLRDEEAAREVVQEVFIKLWEQKEGAAHLQKLQDYLFIIARNIIFNQFKKRANQLLALKEYLPANALQVNNADHPLQEKMYDELLRSAIDKLPPERKKIYLLAKEQGYSYEAIAGLLGISPFTVKNQMAQALRFIRLYINRHLYAAVAMPFVLYPLFS